MHERRTALITGASRGIGAATALTLAEHGCNVAINYLTHAQEAEDVVRHVGRLGVQALAIQADVADYDAVCRMVEQTVQYLGSLHILVNNAGVTQHARLEALSPPDWQQMVAVTLSGAFYCAKAAVPQMKQAGWGRIVNVASLRALTGSDHGAHYASAKAGLIGLTRSLALELAPQITVNAVAPGYTLTEMNREIFAQKGDQICAQIPLRRFAQPQEIAALIAFLCSEEAGYLTGQTISANGGIYLG
jgi:3-oxoacyl-[acyl-carrier protein] reductase